MQSRTAPACFARSNGSMTSRWVGPVSALDALRRCTESPPVLAVIHVDLGEISGTELCQLIRGRKATEDLPLLLFSSRIATYDPPTDRLRSADAFSPRADLNQVVAKLRSLVERPAATNSSGQLITHDGSFLSANFERVQVSVDGKRVDLTRREIEPASISRHSRTPRALPGRISCRTSGRRQLFIRARLALTFGTCV